MVEKTINTRHTEVFFMERPTNYQETLLVHCIIKELRVDSPVSWGALVTQQPTD